MYGILTLLKNTTVESLEKNLPEIDFLRQTAKNTQPHTLAKLLAQLILLKSLYRWSQLSHETYHSGGGAPELTDSLGRAHASISRFFLRKKFISSGKKSSLTLHHRNAVLFPGLLRHSPAGTRWRQTGTRRAAFDGIPA